MATQGLYLVCPCGAPCWPPAVPALQAMDVLLPPLAAVLSRLLVPDLSADFLQDPLFGLRGEKRVRDKFKLQNKMADITLN